MSKYYETCGDWYFYRAGYTLGGTDNGLLEFYKVERDPVEDGVEEIHKYILFHLNDKFVSTYTQCYHVLEATGERTSFTKAFKLLPEEVVALNYKLTELNWI